MTIDSLSIKNTKVETRNELLEIIKPRLRQLMKTMSCDTYSLFFWNHQIHMYECLISDCLSSKCPEPYCIDAKEFIFEKNIIPTKEVTEITHYESIEKIDSIMNEDFAEYIKKCKFRSFYYIPIISEQKKKEKQKIGELFLLYLDKKGEFELVTAQNQIDNLILIIKNYFSNIRIYRKTHQIKYIMELAEKIATSTKSDEIYKIIAEEGLKKFNKLYTCDAGIIIRIREGDNLKAIYKSPPNSAIKEFVPCNEPPFDPIFKEKKSVIINYRDDIITNFIIKYKEIDPKYAEWIENDVKSLMHIPLIISEEVEGVLCIHQNFENAFGEAETRYFEDLAKLSALTLKHLKAYQEAEKKVIYRVNQLKSMHQLIKEIIKQDKKEELLQTILNAGLKLVKAKSGSIRLLNKEKNILFRVAKSHEPTLDGNVDEIKVGRGICGKVAETGKSRLVTDSFEDKDWLALQKEKWDIDPREDPFGEKLSEKTGIQGNAWMRSEISVPLISDKDVSGAMDSHHEKPDYFDDADLKFFEDLAAISALVIRKSKLADQVNTIQAITQYYQNASGSVLEKFLDDVLFNTLKVLEAEKGAIAITEFESGKPKLKFISTGGIDKLKQNPYRKLDDGLIGKTAIGHTTRNYKTFVNVQDHIVLDENIKSELIAPMLFDNKLQGIVMVASNIENRFDKDDEFIISTIANAAAVHIYNIKLLNEREENFRKIITETIRNMMTQTGMLVHQIKNPLIAIQLSAYNLIQKTQSEDTKKYSQIILNHVNNTAETIQRMLDFAKSSSIKNVGDIHYILDETITFIKDLQRKKNINIFKEYDSSIELFSFDRFQLQQSFYNIILNAYQAMEKKGDTLIIKTLRVDDKLHVSFTDNGIGMDEETKRNIFEPLYTTRKDDGTGLGLSLAQQYVHNNNGLIEVESKKGEGTTFTIILPYQKGEPYA